MEISRKEYPNMLATEMLDSLKTELSRKEYPELLHSLQPAQAVALLNERVKRIGRINNEVAEWLQERRKTEEAYAQGLARLARRPLPDNGSELGIFATPWRRIIHATELIASSHQTLAYRIEVDVERPLKDFMSTNREMQSLSTIQGNLATMAREIENATDRAEKLRKKGPKIGAGKMANAASDIESATSQWNSQAPFVFESLQAVDETRLNHLRDVLTQFQTYEIDQAQRTREAAENCFNALLDAETASEIKAFVTKTLESKPKPERQSSRPAIANALAPPSSSDDNRSQVSGKSTGGLQSDSGPEPRHEGRSGLRRLGTFLSRRKSLVPSARGVSPEKRSSDKYAPLGQDIPDVPPLPLMDQMNSPQKPLPSGRQELPASEPSPSSRSQQTPQAAVESNGSPDEFANSSIVHTPTAINGSMPTDTTTPPAQEPATVGTAGTAAGAGLAVTDTEGYSTPSISTDTISQAEQEALNENPQSSFRLDIRNDPIQEEDGDAMTAMANVANTLRAQAASNRKSSVPRGRRDVRNTIFIPSPQASEVSPGEPPLPPFPSKPSRSATLASEDYAGSDTQSVRSARSVTSTAGAASVRHPEMNLPGLNSSVVEIVNASFDHGQMTKAVVLGEMALHFNPTNLSASLGSESIRLENFPVLEKVAPNPIFITPIPDKSGEYSLSLNHITRTAVAFKYQLHLDETNLAAHAPIVLTPTWKIEPTRASVIVTYNLSQLFKIPDAVDRITLRNLIIIIHIEGAKPTTCQTKPVGTFSKETTFVYFKLGDVALERGAAPSKVVARFTTETEAKPGQVEARWEIDGKDVAGLGSELGLSQLSSPPSSTFASAGNGADAGGGGGEGAHDDPFADEDAALRSQSAWKEVPVLRRLVSGKYVAT